MKDAIKDQRLVKHGFDKGVTRDLVQFTKA